VDLGEAVVDLEEEVVDLPKDEVELRGGGENVGGGETEGERRARASELGLEDAAGVPRRGWIRQVRVRGWRGRGVYGVKTWARHNDRPPATKCQKYCSKLKNRPV
jgi:hypothetical protein